MSTSIPQNKMELIEAIGSTYEKLRADLVDISDELSCQQELEGHVKGTKMSICDLVSYLVGWGNLVLKWHSKKEKAEKVDFPETDYKWNELGKLARKFYTDYKDDNFKTLLEKLDKVVKDIHKLIEKKDNTQLYGTLWYEKWTMGRMIQFNTSSPYKNARNRIRKWKKQRGLM